MFATTRRRLALWYTVVTAILLLVFASGFYLYVRSTLIERVDDTLHHVVEVVQRSLVVEPTAQNNKMLSYQVNLEASFRQDSEAVEDDRIELEWFGTGGELLWSTLTDPIELPIHLSHRGETVAIAPNFWWRQLTEKIEINGNFVGYLRVSHPWFEVTKPTRELVVELFFGTSLMVGIVAAIGWFLSQLAIEPIIDSYESLKQFTADASHELRNPIALLQTTVQVALSEPELNPNEQRQQLETVERITQRLGRLVDDLLFLARQDSGMVQAQFQACPLDALLMETVEEQTAIAQVKSTQIHLDIGDPAQPLKPGEEPFTLAGDYSQLSRLFTNLVSNAIQYTPNGGMIKLQLRSTQTIGPPILTVTVQDNGMGISAEALPKLFDRFYRADPARSRIQTKTETPMPLKTDGSGLGLAIAQSIARTHHGTIKVRSKPGSGTTVTVQLPVSSGKG